MLKKILLFIVFLFLGLTLFFAVRWVLIALQVQTIISPNAQSKFSLATAPSQSFTIQVGSFSGNVLWQSRIAKQPTPMVGLQTLQQGEEIDTLDNGKASLSLNGVASISVSSLSSLNFIQTLPVNIVVEEKQGLVEYSLQNTQVPFSVRALDLLINITGDSVITVDKKASIITIYPKSGKATLAYNDTNNVSQVIELKSGQKAIFTNDTKTVVIQ